MWMQMINQLQYIAISTLQILKAAVSWDEGDPFAVMEQLAQIFDCQMDASQIALAHGLLQNGVHPEALASIIQGARSGQEQRLSDEAELKNYH
jgi:hypothetical protein